MRQRTIDGRLLRGSQVVNHMFDTVLRLRTIINKRKFEQLSQLERDAIKAFRGYKADKSLSNDALFDTADADKDGKLSETDLQAFLKLIQEPEAPKVETPPAEDAGKHGEDAEKDKENPSETNGNVAVEPAVPVLKAPVAPRITMAEGEVSLLFKYLDEEAAGFISKTAFVHMVKDFMRVVESTVATNELPIGTATTARRLDSGELVEVLETGSDDDVGVKRVRCRFLKDNREGWVTIASNAGNVFLEVALVLNYRVLQSVDLQPQFNKTDEAKPIYTRQLSVNEHVQALQFPLSVDGVERVKVKTKTDGLVGWAISRPSEGDAQLELLDGRA